MKLTTNVLHSVITKGGAFVIGDCVISVNSDMFGVGLSELIYVEQQTYQNDDGVKGRFIGLCGSRRAAAGLETLARRRRQEAHSVGLYSANISLN
jgi:hypothetical protein